MNWLRILIREAVYPISTEERIKFFNTANIKELINTIESIVVLQQSYVESGRPYFLLNMKDGSSLYIMQNERNKDKFNKINVFTQEYEPENPAYCFLLKDRIANDSKTGKFFTSRWFLDMVSRAKKTTSD